MKMNMGSTLRLHDATVWKVTVVIEVSTTRQPITS